MTTPEDEKRMAELGVYGEAYTQIYMADTCDGWKNGCIKKIGSERFKKYLNLRSLVDHGVRLAAATDLPFLLPSIPEAVYYGCGSYCADRKEKLNPQNALTLPEMLKAWTSGSAYAMERENKTGTLEVGKLADIAVFDHDVFHTEIEEMLEVNICMTIVDGKIAYRTI